MLSTRTNRLLLLLILLVAVAAPIAAAQQTPAPDSVTIRRQLNLAVSEGDAQKFAANIDLVSAKERDELLLYAVSVSTKPSIEIVRVLLDKGANVNQPSRYKTALMEAVKGGHTAIVKLLLASGADVKAVNRNNEPAVILAARQRNYRTPAVEPTAEIVELLLAHGADPNAANRYGETALMLANTAAKVKLLVAAGAQLETKDDEGRTPLLKAALQGEAAVANALIASGANVNAVDNEGCNVLLHALDRENLAYGNREALPQKRLEVARTLLLARSLDVNAQNNDGETALMRAVRLANFDLIKALLARGADANRTDLFGATAATLAYAAAKPDLEQLLPAPKFKRQPANVLNAFLRAAIGRNDEMRVKELLNAGADPNHEYAIGYRHKSIKTRVLVQAAGLGHAGIVQLLLDKGADVNAQGLISGSEHGLKYGTALEAAELSKKPEVAALLRKTSHD